MKITEVTKKMVLQYTAIVYI